MPFTYFRIMKRGVRVDRILLCLSCGSKLEENNNFCTNCGAKLKDVCIYCWVLKKDNFNCGKESCPGYELFTNLKSY